jgi:hypothetical protein
MPAVVARPFTFDQRTRRFRGPSGRFIPWAEVRKALDFVIDAANADIRKTSKALQAGRIEVADFQSSMAASIKAAHVAATLAAKGGRQQVTAADWSTVGNRLKFQYQRLHSFSVELANGAPLDGRFLARAAMYGTSATGTYEAILRRDDLASGLYDEERRQRHSKESCTSCIRYEQLGWQKLGILPDIGQQSECLSADRCTFVRRRSSNRAAPTTRTAARPVARPIPLAAAAFSRAVTTPPVEMA